MKLTAKILFGFAGVCALLIGSSLFALNRAGAIRSGNSAGQILSIRSPSAA